MITLGIRLEMINDTIALEAEIRQLKQDNERYSITLGLELELNYELKQKLEKIRINVKCVDYDGDRVRAQIQEILRGNEGVKENKE